MINLTLNITINLKDKDKVEVLVDKPEEEKEKLSIGKSEKQDKDFDKDLDETLDSEIHYPENQNQTIAWPETENYEEFMKLSKILPKITFAGAFKAHLWKILWRNGIVEGQEDFIESFNSGNLRIGLRRLYWRIDDTMATVTSWWEAIIWREDDKKKIGVMPIECKGKKYLLQVMRYRSF